MKKLFYIAVVFFWVIPSCFAQLKSYSFEEAEKLSSQNPKPFLVFIHTDWCKYCEIMENSTLKNTEIIKLLNNYFYFILLDAENRKDITFNNHIFKYIPKGQNSGIHELATALATINQQIVFPSITVLDIDYSIILQKHSYQDSKRLLTTLEKIKEYIQQRQNKTEQTMEL